MKIRVQHIRDSSDSGEVLAVLELQGEEPKDYSSLFWWNLKSTFSLMVDNEPSYILFRDEDGNII